MATKFHAEHVGSLLRPRWLLDARSAHQQGTLDGEALREAEDRAAAAAIELQRDAGIEVFTDGEVRRDTWMAGFSESTGGVVPIGTPRVPWHRAGGDPPVEDTDFDSVAVTGKVSRRGTRTATGLAELPPEVILNATVKADAALVRAARRRNPDVTIGMHICRGNNRSAWMAQGSYEPVAERLFGDVGVDRFLLEYDTERAGGFAPLRFIRPGTTVVLGLVSSKLPQLESPDELRRRVDDAARYVPIADLALSPQCGFASTSRGNQLTVDEERRKLELVANTAALIWA